MLNRFYFITLIILVLSFSACNSNPGKWNDVEFENLDIARYITPDDEGTTVIRNLDEWDYFISKNYYGDMVIEPPVNFDDKFIIAVYWGCGYGGCTNMTESIESVRFKPGKIVVDVGPLSDLGSCEMVVCPIQMVAIDRIDATVSFNIAR
ncbi:MAG: hypothetical protein GF307_01900 [candidate division Zixibacteria bacterium]|nr:hypothetical protein [candidate division Zixibacteria bacterium]